MCYYIIFDKKSGTSKKIAKFNHAHKMLETFGKSWVLLICRVDVVTLLTDGTVAHSFTRERLPGSISVICLLATKYF